MSIGRQNSAGLKPEVRSPESMYGLVKALGMVPLFENAVPGWSVEEHTPADCWFTDDNLGPWDWKIEVVRSGDVAYGKFIGAHKAAFATVDWYRELRNYRRSIKKGLPDASGQAILDYVCDHGSISIREVRQLLGVKKSAADAAVAKLQWQTRLVTGDIIRVYRGPDLHYNGWQTSSFCTPESLFCTEGDFVGLAGFPGDGLRSLDVDHSPEESLRMLVDKVRESLPEADPKAILKLLL